VTPGLYVIVGAVIVLVVYRVGYIAGHRTALLEQNRWLCEQLKPIRDRLAKPPAGDAGAGS
jgi:hypothetical protein